MIESGLHAPYFSVPCTATDPLSYPQVVLVNQQQKFLISVIPVSIHGKQVSTSILIRVKKTFFKTNDIVSYFSRIFTHQPRFQFLGGKSFAIYHRRWCISPIQTIFLWTDMYHHLMQLEHHGTEVSKLCWMACHDVSTWCIHLLNHNFVMKYNEVMLCSHTWYFIKQMMRSEHHPNFTSKYSLLMLGTPRKRNFWNLISPFRVTS